MREEGKGRRKREKRGRYGERGDGERGRADRGAADRARREWKRIRRRGEGELGSG